MKRGRKSGKWEEIGQRPRVVGTRKERIIGISKDTENTIQG